MKASATALLAALALTTSTTCAFVVGPSIPNRPSGFSPVSKAASVSSWAPLFATSETTAETEETAVAKTITTTEKTPLQQEAMEKFFSPDVVESIEVDQADGGVSNHMYFITVPSEGSDEKKRFILRIYNNGGASNVVQFEHAILQQLAQKHIFSFEIPTSLPVLSDPSQTHTLLSSGDQTCIFNVIPGKMPKLEAVEQIGKASGELHTAMGQLDTEKLPPTTQPPYYELYKVHHAITRDLFYENIRSATFDPAREDIDRLIQHVQDLEERLELFKKKQLPTQLIHGDLHYDNVLIDPETKAVNGLLDFEYCGYDWRAMELAVCLSKYSGEPDPLTYFEQFVRGYAQTAELTPDEVDSVPDLMVLRIISNVVFFVGRTITGEDQPEQLITRAAMYNSRIEWILKNRQMLSDLIVREMAKNHAGYNFAG